MDQSPISGLGLWLLDYWWLNVNLVVIINIVVVINHRRHHVVLRYQCPSV